MAKFILKRLGMMLIAMFMIILLTFVIMHSVPGSPFTNTKGVPEEVIAAMEAKYGLDQPYYVQFFSYLGGVLQGDFGPSYRYTGQTVNDFIAAGAPVSGAAGPGHGGVRAGGRHPHGHPGGAEKRQMAGYAADGAGHHRRDHPLLCHCVAADLCVFPYMLNWLPTFGLDSWQGYILPVIALGGYSVSYIAR